MFTPDPIPRPSGPPASSAPLHDYFSTPRPGADAAYVVLPRSLMEAMPLPWQQHMTYLLSEFHQAFSHVTWPIYRVQPSRHEKLVDLDEEQLAEVGYLVEIDAEGEVVYRDRTGRLVGKPADTTVLVSCLDPIPPPRPPAGRQGGNQGGAPRPGPIADAPANQPPASQPPVNQGPPNQAPVNQVPPNQAPADQPPGSDAPDTPPTGFPVQQVQPPGPPLPPGQPFGPVGYQRPGRRSRRGQQW